LPSGPGLLSLDPPSISHGGKPPGKDVTSEAPRVAERPVANRLPYS
jgi:hypothetical protein